MPKPERHAPAALHAATQVRLPDLLRRYVLLRSAADQVPQSEVIRRCIERCLELEPPLPTEEELELRDQGLPREEWTGFSLKGLLPSIPLEALEAEAAKLPPWDQVAV